MRMRWVIVSLLFFATTINYLDRAILGVILPEIRDNFHFGLPAYGTIQMAFQLAYAGGSLLGGKLLDRYGTRVGYGLAVVVWSLAATLNAFAGSALQFGLFRTVLGLGESANFPACSKATAEWFPPDERATSMGIVNAGTNIANIIGPPLFILIASEARMADLFRNHGRAWISLAAHLAADLPAAEDSGRACRANFETLDQGCAEVQAGVGLRLGNFLTDPIWWFYLFWLPTYLTDVRHFTPSERGTALTIVYSISGLGALAGGVVSSALIKHGWTVGKSRKMTLLFCAVIMPACSLGVVVQIYGSRWCCLAWPRRLTRPMTNLFTTPADVFPSQAVGSANGFGVCVGGLGGALFSGIIPGLVIPHIGYVPVLLGMSCFYVPAWFIVHRLMGNLEMVTLREDVPGPAPLAHLRA